MDGAISLLNWLTSLYSNMITYCKSKSWLQLFLNKLEFTQDCSRWFPWMDLSKSLSELCGSNSIAFSFSAWDASFCVLLLIKKMWLMVFFNTISIHIIIMRNMLRNIAAAKQGSKQKRRCLKIIRTNFPYQHCSEPTTATVFKQNLARANRIWPAYVAGWSW